MASISRRDDEASSELGDLFSQEQHGAVGGGRSGVGVAGAVPHLQGSGGGVRYGVSAEGLVRGSPEVGRRFGRGPVSVDPRKFKYDRVRAMALPSLVFGATKADRMDASEAGALLHEIHVMYGIDAENEDVIAAFDKALFFEHTINGASMMQPGRGELTVGKSSFELAPVKAKLGVGQRRFFRAYADEIAEVNREVLAALDHYNPVTVEQHGQLMQVAVDRGLQKYPHLAHDSSDAGLRLSLEERYALNASKRLVLPMVENAVDKPAARASVASLE